MRNSAITLIATAVTSPCGRRRRRGDGRRLLLRSVRAQAMLDEATAIELALSRPGDRPPVGLADRIFEAAFRSEPSDRGFDLDEEMERPGRLM
ncbi:hypothetical protein ACIU1J_29755 [Azospirillum doebereinerae]|uniref:hypothetical protein n=1 Tax=Azospirillum doebereinerae TaxID=92933 RepID=UPI00384BE1CA